jgi:hypothetical protein
MSNEPKDPKGTSGLPPEWRGWYREVRTALRDHEAVTKDLLRRKRKRDLGVREAKRLYRDASDTLAKLLAYAGGSGGGDDGEGGDESGRDPAGSGGSPAY